MTNKFLCGDNLGILRRSIPDEIVDLTYLDPPFNSNANYKALFQDNKLTIYPTFLATA